MIGQSQVIDQSRPKEAATLERLFFDKLRRESVLVSCYLTNGIKLEGRIDAVDHSVVYLKGADVTMVYRHAIASVVRASSRAAGNANANKRA